MLAILFTAAIVLNAMSPEEMEETGLVKLTVRERLALQDWIEYKSAKKKRAGPILEEVIKAGRFIRLTDRSLWEISLGDKPITQSWITQVEIQVAPSGEEDYPFRLTNTLTGSSVKARKAENTD